MSNTKHTPGPWTHDETWGLIMAGETEIAACHSGVKENARLIAAAPELYVWTRELLTQLKIESNGKYAGIIEHVEKLLKRVEGSEHE
jgi:hypothetical protein